MKRRQAGTTAGLDALLPAILDKALNPEPKGENIEHPTSNIEPPMAARWAVIGCWAFDVGCWMFPGFRERYAGRYAFATCYR